jgi:hypothetical protein
MHKIMNKKFYLSPKFGTLIHKSWITISELLQEHILNETDLEFEQFSYLNRFSNFKI